MRSIGVAFGLVIVLLGFISSPFLLDAFESWRYTSTSTTAVLTTGAGESSGNITLGHNLYDSNLDSVVSIMSSDSTDAPAPHSYSGATYSLNVAGLQPSTSRTLTITYNTDRTDSYLPTLAGVIPIFLLMGMIAIGAGLSYKAWTR